MLPPNCLRIKIMILKCFTTHHFWADICSRSKSVSRKQPSAMYMRVEDSMARLKCRVPRSRYKSRQSRAADLFGCVHTVASTPSASLPQQVERDSVYVSVNGYRYCAALDTRARSAARRHRRSVHRKSSVLKPLGPPYIRIRVRRVHR